MALTQVTSEGIADSAITSAKISSSVALGGPKITAIEVCDANYTVLDDTAVALTGGYIKITGSGFAQGVQVLVNSTPATSVALVNSTTVHAQLPAKTAGSYVVYLVNSDGGVAISVTGVSYSDLPAWTTASTLPVAAVNTSFSIQLQAPPASVFAIAPGSTLPPGATLSSTGLLSGTVAGLTSDTTYNFTINAIDSENQDSPRTFALLVSVSVTGQVAFTTAGTYTWVAPTGVTSVCAVAIGGGSSGNGQNGGGGGGLGWRNEIPVVPGQSYTVVVGKGGYRAGSSTNEVSGDYSMFYSGNVFVVGYGGSGVNGGTYTGVNGGNGGQGGTYVNGGRYPGGGGAGGYTGSGGGGGTHAAPNGQAGTGGSAGGGGASSGGSGGGGGTGLFGQGASGAGGVGASSGWPTTGASGGSLGDPGSTVIAGGNYGGGSGGAGVINWSRGGGGAVRIIWGAGRAFPSTLTSDQ